MNFKIKSTFCKAITIIFCIILYFVCIGAATKGIFLLRQPELSHPDKEDYFPIVVKVASGIEIMNIRDVLRHESYELACENTAKMHCVGGGDQKQFTNYYLDYFDGDYRYEVQYISVGKKIYPVSKKIGSIADLFTAVLYVTGMIVLVALIIKLSGKLRRKLG